MIELRDIEPDDVTAIEPWFDEPETQIRLGGRDWLHMVVALVAPPERVALIGWQDGERVAFVDVEHLETTSFAIVIAPERRGEGIATAVVGLLLETELAGRRLLVSAEADNRPSLRLLARHGFVPQGGTDADGFVEYVRP